MQSEPGWFRVPDVSTFRLEQRQFNGPRRSDGDGSMVAAPHTHALLHEDKRALCCRLFAVHYETPPLNEQVVELVESMFATLDTNGNGLIEAEELLQGYVSFPLITECFSNLQQQTKVPTAAVASVDAAESEPTVVPREPTTTDAGGCGCTTCSVQ